MSKEYSCILQECIKIEDLTQGIRTSMSEWQMVIFLFFAHILRMWLWQSTGLPLPRVRNVNTHWKGSAPEEGGGHRQAAPPEPPSVLSEQLMRESQRVSWATSTAFPAHQHLHISLCAVGPDVGVASGPLNPRQTFVFLVSWLTPIILAWICNIFPS